MTTTDEDIVDRFVLRARRISAHSLVQDQEAFAERLQERFTLRRSLDGRATLVRSLPADEEVFESLAARVRPLSLPGESIYYKNVLAALRRLMQDVPSVTAQQWQRLDELDAAWLATELEPKVQAYAMQSSKVDGTERTGLVSDTELAAGWMYADLVHVDAKSWKKRALDFSLQERYLAAVGVFSRMTALTVSTLRLVEDLHHSGALLVDTRMWDADVVVGVTEIVYEDVTAYTAAEGTEMPELNQPGHPGGPWTQITITSRLRADPARRVLIELVDADEAVIVAHEAAIVRHDVKEGVLHWQASVADVFLIRARFVGDDEVTMTSVDAVPIGDSHQSRLATGNFLLQLHEAKNLVLNLPGDAVVRAEVRALAPDALSALRWSVDLLDDVVTLEEVTGQVIAPFTRPLTVQERVRVRQARLLRQGRVIQWDRSLPGGVSPHGDTPTVVTIEPMAVDIAGAAVEMPQLRCWHPEATWNDEGPVPDFGPDAHSFTVTTPEGTRWLAWSPPARSVDGDDDQPLQGELWNITGIDQNACPF